MPEPLKSSAYALIEANKRAEDFANVAKQDQKAIDDLTKSQQKGIDEYQKTEKATPILKARLTLCWQFSENMKRPFKPFLRQKRLE